MVSSANCLREILLFIQVTLVLSVVFDCRRDGARCNDNGVCQDDNGQCLCNPTHVGYDCGLRRDLVALANPCNCLNGGTCFFNQTVLAFTCICLQEWSGANCENNNVRLSCKAEHMTLYINLPSSFEGSVTVQGYGSETPGCAVLPSIEYPEFLAVDFSYNSSVCGTVVTNLQDGKTSYQNYMIIQYKAEYITRLDQRYIITCTLYNEISVSASISSVNFDFESLKQDAQNESPSPLQTKLSDQESNEVGEQNPQNVGDLVNFHIELPQNDIYGDFRVSSCYVTDGLRIKIPLIQSSCLLDYASRLFIKGFTRENNQVTITVQVFVFATTDDFIFSCRVLLCRIGQTGCEPVTCDEANGFQGPGLGRKRRSVTNSTEEFVIIKKLTVDNPTRLSSRLGINSTEQQGGEQVSEKTCAISEDVIISGSILGAVILLLAISTIFFSLKYWQVRRKLQTREYLTPPTNF